MFQKEKFGWKELTIFMIIAYLFSFAIRMIWIWQFKDTQSFYWNGQLMINTNDGYFFASAVDHMLNGGYGDNPRVPIAWEQYPGMVYVSYLLAKYTPMSLETTILYMPAIISSFVVVPMVLIGNLIRLPWVGFFSALLGSVTWSYYNRTMVGYYDSDMFAVVLQFTLVYFFLLTLYDRSLKNILGLAVMLAVYPLFYSQGLSLIYAMFVIWGGYQLWYQRDDRTTYIFITVAATALWPLPILLKLGLIIVVYGLLNKFAEKAEQKQLIYTALFAVIIFLLFGNAFGLIINKVMGYMNRGVTAEGLHFYQVIQTVREAGTISWQTVANRIAGGAIPLLISLLGYIWLITKHRTFLIALPLIGVGIFAHWAGLRFTVYAVPIAAFSSVYLFWTLAEYFVKSSKLRLLTVAFLTAAMLYPNITHIIGYKVPTVFRNAEVKDLAKLDKIADTKDYTLAWWDYGYPLWFYSHTNTLIDGGKHHNDNFIISKIMQTTSPELAARLSRLAVETYVDSNYSVVANTLFKNGQPNQKDPNLVLEEIESGSYPIPPKSREVYLYMPMRMMNIFPTVMVFGNLDLTTGKPLRKVRFYPTRALKQQAGRLWFANGVVFDTKKGELTIRGQKIPVKKFVVAQLQKNGKIRLKVQSYHFKGDWVVLYLKSYGRFVIMDEETFRSMYVQMFMLGKYDKKLFEPVVASPYTRIYKLKI